MSEFDRFAELHCHPHMRSFNWLQKHRRPGKKSRYNSRKDLKMIFKTGLRKGLSLNQPNSEVAKIYRTFSN